MYIRFYVEMNSLSKSAFHVCVCREKVILSVDTDRSEIIGQIAVRDKLGQNRELRTKLEEQWGKSNPSYQKCSAIQGALCSTANNRHNVSLELYHKSMCGAKVVRNPSSVHAQLKQCGSPASLLLQKPSEII